MKIKKPHFTKDILSSTIGSYLVCQWKLRNVSIYKVLRMWKRFQEKDDLKHSEKYGEFIHWINIYWGISDKEVPIVAVYSDTTKNIIHALFYDNFILPIAETLPLALATLVYPTKVWDLKGEFIKNFYYYDWKGVKHSSKEVNNVAEKE